MDKLPVFGQGLGEVDLDTSEGLYNLAQMQGGSIAQISDELRDPNRGILSTVGNGFKNAFKGFIDIISMPQQFVAGALSSKYTVGEAIDQNINPSDIVFGQNDPNASTMKKVGSWVVRTATDVLFDPLTYVTFGTAKGLQLTLSATDKVLDVGKAFGVTGDTLTLSKRGTEVFNKAVNMQINGLKATALKTADKELTGEALDIFVKNTIDAGLDTDFIKRSMVRMLGDNPALMETFVDKGGIKFFGNSIIEGHRISNAIKAIPGYTYADNLTKDTRNFMFSLVNTNYTPSGRIPQESIDIMQKWKDIAEASKSDVLQRVTRVWSELRITKQEDDLIRSSVELGKMPADPRLAQAYKAIKGFTDENLNRYWGAGIPVHKMDNYIPHYLKNEEVKVLPFTKPLSTSSKAQEFASLARFIPQATDGTGTLGKFEEAVLGSSEKLGLTQVGKDTYKDVSGRIFKRERITVEEAGTLGVEFDPSAISTLVRSSMDAIKSSSIKHMFDDLAQKVALPQSMAQEGWRGVQIKGLKNEMIDFSQFVVSKNGEQLVFHPETAKRLEEFSAALINDEATNELMKKYDKVLNLWKASVTSIFPAFHGRNAISNVFLNYLDIGKHALNPENHIQSAKMIGFERKTNQLLKKMIKEGADDETVKEAFNSLMSEKVLTDANGYDWTWGEMRRVLKENNIAFNKNLTGAVDVSKPDSTVYDNLFPADTIKEKVGRAIRKPLDFGTDVVGATVEAHGRIINFLANLQETGDVTHAAKRTKMFLFDYSNLTNFEKTFMKRILPFYTFTRKNLELQVRTLLKDPGKISQEVTALNNLGDVLAGGSLTEEEKKVLPNWITEGMNILRTKKDGTVTMLSSFGTPIEAAFSPFKPNQLLGSVSPIIRVPIEQMSGYSFYNEKMLSEATNAAGYKKAPKVIQDFIGFSEVKGKTKEGKPYTFYVALRPERMNIVNNLPFTSKTLGILKNMQDENIQGQEKLWNLIVGTKFYTLDLEQEARKRENENKKKLEEVLMRAGAIGQFKRTFIPKTE